jgi:hypothetical protein
MKKLFIVMAVASLGFVACNNDSGTDATEAKRIADSTRVADSLKNVSNVAVPTAAELETKRIQDSTRVADSLANAAKNKMGGK